jgi:hypothetical protein
MATRVSTPLHAVSILLAAAAAGLVAAQRNGSASHHCERRMLPEGRGVRQRGLEVGQELEHIAGRVSRLGVAPFDRWPERLRERGSVRIRSGPCRLTTYGSLARSARCAR